MNENCEKFKEKIFLYAEGKLPENQKADIEQHLLNCPKCIFLLKAVPHPAK